MIGKITNIEKYCIILFLLTIGASFWKFHAAFITS